MGWRGAKVASVISSGQFYNIALNPKTQCAPTRRTCRGGVWLANKRIIIIDSYLVLLSSVCLHLQPIFNLSQLETSGIHQLIWELKIFFKRRLHTIYQFLILLLQSNWKKVSDHHNEVWIPPRSSCHLSMSTFTLGNYEKIATHWNPPEAGRKWGVDHLMTPFVSSRLETAKPLLL